MYHGEKFNSITHLIGIIFGIAATSILVTMGALKNDAYRIVGFSVYGAMMIILYTMSTLYHSFKDEKLKNIFMKLDHISIYLMIAGTYTPFALLAIKGVWGWAVLIIIWVLAVFGIVQELLIAHKTRAISLITYMAMGWLAIFVLKRLSENLPFAAIIWMIGGGLLYTVGFLFYLFDEKIKHGHGIWHLFVLGGTVCHFACLVGYLA